MSAPTSNAKIDEPHGFGHAKLGTAFWVKWSVGLVLILAAFGAAMVLNFNNMDSAPGAALGGFIVLVFTGALIALMMVPHRVLQKRGLEGKMRPAYRRYTLRFLPAMTGYVVGLLAAMLIMKEYHPTGALAWIVGLMPSIPILFAVRAIVLLPRDETDEFLRDGIYRVYSLANGGTLAICTVYGFLDMFDVVPNVDLWAVFPVWAVCLGVAQAVNARRSR